MLDCTVGALEDDKAAALRVLGRRIDAATAALRDLGGVVRGVDERRHALAWLVRSIHIEPEERWDEKQGRHVPTGKVSASGSLIVMARDFECGSLVCPIQLHQLAASSRLMAFEAQQFGPQPLALRVRFAAPSRRPLLGAACLGDLLVERLSLGCELLKVTVGFGDRALERLALHEHLCDVSSRSDHAALKVVGALSCGEPRLARLLTRRRRRVTLVARSSDTGFPRVAVCEACDIPRCFAVHTAGIASPKPRELAVQSFRIGEDAL
jgi:hypothetical protein